MMLKMRMFLGCRFLHNSNGDKCQKVVNPLTKVSRACEKAKSKFSPASAKRAKPEPGDSVLYGKVYRKKSAKKRKVNAAEYLTGRLLRYPRYLKVC